MGPGGGSSTPSSHASATKLVLSAFPRNQGGMTVYRRAGFSEVGTYREQGLLDDWWVDTIVMEKIHEGPNAH